MKNITTVLCIICSLVFVFSAANAEEVGSSCESSDVSGYIKIIEDMNPTAMYLAKNAAECALQISPAKETHTAILHVIEIMLGQIKDGKQKSYSYYGGRKIIELAGVLKSVGDNSGFEAISKYYSHVDWKNKNDRALFADIATSGYSLKEMSEIYYVALSTMPITEDKLAGNICSMFNRGDNFAKHRNDPKYIKGVLSVLSKIYNDKSNNKAKYTKHYYDETVKRCEDTLRSQLLDTRMNKSFMFRYYAKLPESEKEILGRFFKYIEPPPDNEVAENMVKAFSSTKWGVEYLKWRQENTDFDCQVFQGAGHNTDYDERWCYSCTREKNRLIEKEFFFPDSKGDSCSLQAVSITVDTTSRKISAQLEEKIKKQFLLEPQKNIILKSKAFYWDSPVMWDAGEMVFYSYVDSTNKVKFGEELPKASIYAKKKELGMLAEKEKLLINEIENNKKAEWIERNIRLFMEMKKHYPELVKKAGNINSANDHYGVVLDAVKLVEKNPKDTMVHYFANYMASTFSKWLTNAPLDNELAKIKEYENTLSDMGIAYAVGYDGVREYNNVFIKKMITNEMYDYWADEGFKDYLNRGCRFGEDSEDYKRIILFGEAFLDKNPATHIKKDLFLILAGAHETGWSFGQASKDDEYIKSKEYIGKSPYHREKSLYYYSLFLNECGDCQEKFLAESIMKRLRMNIDTNSRKYYCNYD